MLVTITEEPGRDLAVTRFQADLSAIGEEMGRAFGTVMGALQRAGVAPSGPAVAYYDITPDGLTVSAGFVVAEPFAGDGAVVPLRLPRREVVTGEHVGPYDQLPTAYDELHAAAEEHGRKLGESVMWEEYLTGPDVPPDQMRTVISWPLE